MPKPTNETSDFVDGLELAQGPPRGCADELSHRASILGRRGLLTRHGGYRPPPWRFRLSFHLEGKTSTCESNMAEVQEFVGNTTQGLKLQSRRCIKRATAKSPHARSNK